MTTLNDAGCGPQLRRAELPCGRRRQGGAIGITFGVMLIALFGIIALAIDLAQVYNRKAELQGLADAVALAAAKELNGQSKGIDNAAAKAAAMAATFSYKYGNTSVVWSDAALSFSSASSAPDTDWVGVSTASGNPGSLLYAKVDTDALGDDIGTVKTFLIKVVMPTISSVTARGKAIAGKSTMNITPLAICAMSTTPAVERPNPGTPVSKELVEYGFRRGVSYDLMNLNPNGTTPETFIVNPVDALGAATSSAHLATSFVSPYVCAGKIMLPAITGGQLNVGRPFPLDALADQLNSRFDKYVGAKCDPYLAPPDENVKEYKSASIPWMSVSPGSTNQSAKSFPDVAKLWTIADPLPAPASNTMPMYGPLWAFARAVPYSSYSTSGEPDTGYTAFSTSTWSTLYPPGTTVASGYPTATTALPNITPYTSGLSAYKTAPSAANRPGTKNRRVLNIPLLECPVASGTSAKAKVLAIGKFLMTVQATTTNIYAEFGGVVTDASLGGAAELYP